MLKSQKTGNVLKVFLKAFLVISVLSIITTLFYVYNYDVYLKIERFDAFIMVFSFILLIMTYVTYLIWLFKVHKDLKQLNPDYHVSPWGAIARVAIPFYCLYGLWNVYSTMHRYFSERTSTVGFGSKLHTYLPIYYFLFIISNGVSRYVSAAGSEQSAMSDAYGPILLISYVLDVFLFTSFLLITNIVLKALKTIKAEVDAESMESEEETQPFTDDNDFPPVNV